MAVVTHPHLLHTMPLSSAKIALPANRCRQPLSAICTSAEAEEVALMFWGIAPAGWLTWLPMSQEPKVGATTKAKLTCKAR